MAENFEIQPMTEVRKNLENQPTTNVTISLVEALNEMSVEPITDELKNLEKETSNEISEDFTNIDTESKKDYFDQESDQSENDSGLGLDPHEGNEMDKINEIESPKSIDNEEVRAIDKLLNFLGNSRYWATHINKSLKKLLCYTFICFCFVSE